MKNFNKQPIIILGGFLINKESYQDMADWLEENEGIKVKIIDVSKFDWLLTNFKFGWIRILDRVKESVEEYRLLSPTGKISLIGHSSGGVMLRQYLSHNSFGSRIYYGRRYCNRLITLGSPHQAKRATKLRSMVDMNLPGSYYSQEVEYISIAGTLDLSKNCASNFAVRTAQKSYTSITGNNQNIGDGLVPVSSSLLKDSKHILLNETAHSKLFGQYWYGSRSRLEIWWKKIHL